MYVSATIQPRVLQASEKHVPLIPNVFRELEGERQLDSRVKLGLYVCIGVAAGLLQVGSFDTLCLLVRGAMFCREEDAAGRWTLGESPNRRLWLWHGAALALLIGFLYADILARLVQQWWNDPNFSHGFFVPAFSAFMIWQQRRRLAAQAVVPCWFGLVVIAGALTILIVGVLGAELFLSRSSFVFLLGGLVIHFLGWRFFRAMLFPWAFLFLMIPLPAIIFNEIAFPLQLLASRLASLLLALLSVPVLREGNVLQLPTMALEVVEACSGIRSLLSLVTLAIIYGYLLDTGVLRRVLLAVAAVPIAVAANGLRVMGTGFLAHYWSAEKAEGFFHIFSGWVIFVLSLGMLFSLHGVMRALGRLRTARKP